MNRCVLKFTNGRSIECPAYPDPCDWIEVRAYGDNLWERVTAEDFRRGGRWAMARLAHALTDGRPPEDLPAIYYDGEHEAADFGDETAVVAEGTGLTIRWAATTTCEFCDYVRVTNPDGSEVAYWTADEWVEDPSGVIGALVGTAKVPEVDATDGR